MTSFNGIRVLTREAVGLYRLAASPVEFASVTAFVSRYLLNRLRNYRDETFLHLQGYNFCVGLSGGEVCPLIEIFGDRIYEHVPSFAVQPSWTVLDIGANVGIFSVQSASLGAHVVAVEPNPTAFHRLVRTIKRNGLQSSIRPLACAIGSECGAANLVLDDGLSIHGRIDFESHEEHTPSIPVLTLDELVCRQGITSVDLLKIDTEGAEADILKGGFGILPRVHRIVLEYHSPVLLSRVRELLGAAGLEEVGKLELYRGDELGIIYFARH